MKPKKASRVLDVMKLTDTTNQEKYKARITQKLDTHKLSNTDIPKKWGHVAHVYKEATKYVVGFKTINRVNDIQNNEIKNLSQKQKKLRIEINACKSNDHRSNLKKQRNKMLKEVHLMIRDKEERTISRQIEELENIKDQPNKMFQAIRHLKRVDKKDKTFLYDADKNIITNQIEQVKIVTNYFKEVYEKTGIEKKLHIEKLEMKELFNREEIELAAKKLKNGKTPGPDDVHSELIKFAPERIGDKLRSVIPLSQAAYTKGRSVTEHLLAEKAITSSEYKLTLLMLDMSSAFDRVNRKKLIEIISQNLEPEELNLIKILIEQVELK
ncbi:uncharacterized protein LOC117111303, partial [Anneissia japonica]|uniref:uncharacterized protein LOC117111303 n=1 Tax=Anneissia japonica TaxID=1529436 RepID=UPI001425B300